MRSSCQCGPEREDSGVVEKLEAERVLVTSSKSPGSPNPLEQLKQTEFLFTNPTQFQFN